MAQVVAPLTGTVTQGTWVTGLQTAAINVAPFSSSGQNTLQWSYLLPAQYNPAIEYPLLVVGHPDFGGMNGSVYMNAATFVNATQFGGGTLSLNSVFNTVQFRTAFPCIIAAPQCYQPGSDTVDNFGGFDDSQNSGGNEIGVNLMAQSIIAGQISGISAASVDPNKRLLFGYSLGAIGVLAWLVDNNQWNGPSGLGLWTAGIGASDQLFRPAASPNPNSLFQRMSDVPYFAIWTFTDNSPSSYDELAYNFYIGNANNTTYPAESNYTSGGMAAVRAGTSNFYGLDFDTDSSAGDPTTHFMQLNSLGGNATAMWTWLFSQQFTGGSGGGTTTPPPSTTNVINGTRSWLNSFGGDRSMFTVPAQTTATWITSGTLWNQLQAQAQSGAGASVRSPATTGFCAPISVATTSTTNVLCTMVDASGTLPNFQMNVVSGFSAENGFTGLGDDSCGFLDESRPYLYVTGNGVQIGSSVNNVSSGNAVSATNNVIVFSIGVAKTDATGPLLMDGVTGQTSHTSFACGDNVSGAVTAWDLDQAVNNPNFVIQHLVAVTLGLSAFGNAGTFPIEATDTGGSGSIPEGALIGIPHNVTMPTGGTRGFNFLWTMFQQQHGFFNNTSSTTQIAIECLPADSASAALVADMQSQFASIVPHLAIMNFTQGMAGAQYDVNTIKGRISGQPYSDAFPAPPLLDFSPTGGNAVQPSTFGAWAGGPGLGEFYNTTWETTIQSVIPSGTGPGESGSGTGGGGGTPTPTPTFTPSANQTVISPGVGSITDDSGNVFTITSGLIATEAVGGVNPQPMPNGSNTGAGEFFNSTVFMQDATSLDWFTWSGTTFVGPVTAPVPPTTGHVITPTTPSGVTAGISFTFQGSLSGENAIPTLTASIDGGPPTALTVIQTLGLTGVLETGWSSPLTIFTSGATTIVVSDGSGATGTTAQFTVNPGTEAANGTTVTTVGPLINASPTPGTAGSGNFLGITSGGQISLNGAVPTAFATSTNVVELFYINHEAFQKNSSGNWFGPITATSLGVATSSPVPVETIAPTTPTGVTAGVPFTFQGVLDGYAVIPSLTFSVNGGTPTTLTGVTLSGWSEIITIANASTGDIITVSDGTGNSGVTGSFVVSAGSVSVGAGPGGAGGTADNGNGGAGGDQVFSFSSQTFSNVSTTQTFSLTEGIYAVTVSATFNGGSVTLEQLSPDGATFVTVLPAFTANTYAVIPLPAGQYQLAIAGATAVYASIAIATDTAGNPGQSNSLGGGGGSGSGGNVTNQVGGAGGWPGGGGGGGGSGSTTNLGGAGAAGLLRLSQPQATGANTATIVANISGAVAKITATSINPATIVSALGAASTKATALVINPARVTSAIGALTAAIAVDHANHVTVNSAIGPVSADIVVSATNTATVTANIGAVTAATLIPANVATQIGQMTSDIVAGSTNPANVSANIGAMTAQIAVANTASVNVTIPSLTAAIVATSINPASVVAAIGPATAQIAATPTNVATVNANIGAMTAQIFSDFSTSAIVAASTGPMMAAIVATQKNPVSVAVETGSASAAIIVAQKNPVSVAAETGALTAVVHAASTNSAAVTAKIGAVTADVSAASRNVATVAAAIGAMTASALVPTVAVINANIGVMTADVQIVLGNKATVSAEIGFRPFWATTANTQVSADGLTVSLSPDAANPNVDQYPFYGNIPLNGMLYWELVVTAPTSSTGFAAGLSPFGGPAVVPDFGFLWNQDGSIASNHGFDNLGGPGTWPAYTSGDTIAFAFNSITGMVWGRVGADGPWSGGTDANPATGVGGLPLPAPLSVSAGVVPGGLLFQVNNTVQALLTFIGQVPAGFSPINLGPPIGFTTTAQASSTNFATIFSEIGPITADIQTLRPNFAAINANIGALTTSAMILFPIQASVDAEIGAMTAAIVAGFIPLPPPGRIIRPPIRRRPVHITTG